MKLKNAIIDRSAAWERLNAAGGRSLPCLNRNNSIEATGGTAAKVAPVISHREQRRVEAQHQQLNDFTTAHRKSAYALELNVKAFIDRFGLNKVGFMTLTFADDVKDPKEAQRRFNSLRTNFLKYHYDHYIRVVERTKSGRIHYHLLVACKEDIRRGLNFCQIAARNYKSANEAIRKHWQNLRASMPKYGFGRSELMPVKTNSKGLAKYVAKYIGKHIDSRINADKGIRLCQTSQDKASKWKAATSHFQFASPGSKAWRVKLRTWVIELNAYFFYCHLVGGYYPNPNSNDYRSIDEDNYSDILKQRLGTKWAYRNRKTIAEMAI